MLLSVNYMIKSMIETEKQFSNGYYQSIGICPFYLLYIVWRHKWCNPTPSPKIWRRASSQIETPHPLKRRDVIIEWSLTTMNNTKQHGPSETPSGFFQNPWAIQEGLLFGRIRYSPRVTLSWNAYHRVFRNLIHPWCKLQFYYITVPNIDLVRKTKEWTNIRGIY